MTATQGISLEELQLAARNHALPLEALRYPITPVGLHYLLVHYDIPAVDAAAGALRGGAPGSRTACTQGSRDQHPATGSSTGDRVEAQPGGEAG